MDTTSYQGQHELKYNWEFTFPFNIYPTTIPSDQNSVPLHWQDDIEIIYVKKGIGIITVNMHSYTVTPGMIVLILPGDIHSIDQYADEIMEYENIFFHPDLIYSRSLDVSIAQFIEPLISKQIHVPEIYRPDESYYDSIIRPIDSIDIINASKVKGYELLIKSELFKFLFVLINQCQSAVITSTDYQKIEKLKIIVKYVEQNYSEPISIADIAEVVSFSESHFMRYFKASFGSSFTDYLVNYRLNVASNMLRGSADSILVIADSVGFDNLSYFNRAFKKKYHMTPREYRKQFTENHREESV